MARHKLGRVTGAVDVPRGPDVIHRIRVPAGWLEEGALIELDLPRNMTCASCEGGGCDKCERSGAISVRGRKEPSEVVQVTLPKRAESNQEITASGRTLVIRIPERGGMSDSPALPRGLLLLSVVMADSADPGVVRVELPSVPPPEERVPEAAAPRAPTPLPPARPRNLSISIGVVLVILWVLFLIWLRMTGRG